LTGQTGGALYVQYRDWAGNVSEVYSDTYQVDLTPPQLFVEVAPGETLTRTVNIFAYDELAALSLMRLSNDPLLFEGLATLPYSETVTWAFDDRRVVWVQVRDSVGNWTEPYPAYAALPEAPVSLALAANWNLIAIPRTLADPTLPAALDSITGTYNLVYAYDACDPADPWKKYDPTAPSFANDLTGMDVQRGYWLLTTQPVTLTVAGARPGATSIPLCAGWNLIGYPSAAPVMLPGALASIAGQYDLVYAYDAADAADPWKKYAPAAPWFTNDLAELGPGKGYWIRMTETGTMVVQ
jgi:hypothetical protein